MDGWISLHRKIRNNPIFNDSQLLRLWLICLTEAYFKPCNVLIGKQDVFIDKGQFPTGRYELHRMYNDGLNAKEVVSEKTVWRWLEKLEKLDFLTINSTNKFSVVALVNWDKYQNNDQQDDQQMTNKRPTDDQQMTTKNKVNKENKENKGNKANKDITKKEYAEKVTLTDDQYQKLIGKYGTEEIVKSAIERLNNYKCSKITKYTSDYHVLIGWVFDDFEKKKLIVLKGGAQRVDQGRQNVRSGGNQTKGGISPADYQHLVVGTPGVPV